MSLNEVSEINGGILFEVSKSKEFRKNKNNISDFRYIKFFLNNVLKEFSCFIFFYPFLCYFGRYSATPRIYN